MNDILNCILDISITGAAATAIVCIARLILRLFGDRSGGVAKRIMWLAVVICFLCPLRITLPYYENAVSPATDSIPESAEQGNHDIEAGKNAAEIGSDFAAVGVHTENSGKVIQNGETPAKYSANVENKIDKIASTIIKTDLSGFITLSGLASAKILAVMLILAVVVILTGVSQYNRLLKSLTGSVRRDDGIWISPGITSPCTVGFIKPRIYLPESMTSANAEYAVLHEQAHIRCLDHIIKPVAYLSFAFNVFNPFAWIMLRLFYADMESHCDAIAVRGMAQNEKIDYCKALVDCASGGRAVLHPAFGGDNIKSRINSVMKHRRAPIVLTAAITSATLILCSCAIFSAAPTVAFSDIDEVGSFPDKSSGTTAVRISCGQGVALLTQDEDISTIASYFSDLKVFDKEVNSSRSEDRDRTVQVTFIMGDGLISDINISADYCEIYYFNYIKPTFSYRVADPDGLKATVSEYVSNIDNCRYTPTEVVWLAPYSSASPDLFEDLAVKAEYTLSSDFTATATSGYITTDHIENARYEPIEVGDSICVLGVDDGMDNIISLDISDYTSVSAYRLYDGGRIAHIIYCLDDEIWVSSWIGNNVTANVENPVFFCNHIFRLA